MQLKPFLELAGISLRINDKLLFRNTRWTFARDQHWALVGPNGSGKTLLAQAIAGELPVVKGEIRYGFRASGGGIPEDRIVLVSFERQKAMAGDAPAAVRWFSAEQENALPVGQFLSQNSVEEINPYEVRKRSRKSAARFKRFRQKVVALMDIEPIMERSLASLSNGETRKIMPARALLKRPRLLILDDAFTGLDSGFRGQKIIESLIRQGNTTIVYVTHVADEIPRGIQKILHLSNGRVLKS